MANKIKLNYRNVDIFIESFHPDIGVFVVTLSYWQEYTDDDNYDDFKNEVLHTKFYKGKEHYYPKQILCWTVGDSYAARRIRKNKAIPFYTDFQLTIRLKNPTVVKYTKREKVNDLGTFRANYPTVLKDIENWLDYLLSLECAPTVIKKEADKSTSYVAAVGFGFSKK